MKTATKAKIVLLIFLSLSLYSQETPAESEKRVVLYGYAAKKPIQALLNIPLRFGRKIDVVQRMYKGNVCWLKFKTKTGREYYIPEIYTMHLNKNEARFTSLLKANYDTNHISYLNPVNVHYRPDDLVLITAFTFRDGALLRKEAAAAFFKMARDAEYEGLNLMAKRGYVSPREQANRFYEAFNAYKGLPYMPYKIDMPTVSSLHSGVVVDITSKNTNYKCEFNFYFSKEYAWLIKNAYKYGFYPFGGSDEMYSFKPYRFRYYLKTKFAKSEKKIPDFKVVDIYGIGKLVISKRPGSNITYFKIHDEETTASRTMRYVFNKYGGRFFEFVNTKNLNNRNIIFSVKGKKYKIDPNRIFTDKGFKKMLKLYNPYYNRRDFPSILAFMRKVRGKILYHLKLGNNKPFFYVHTNKYYTVLSTDYLKKHNIRGKLFKIYRNPHLHPKVFLYVLRRDDYNYFKKLGISCVLQKRGGSGDDGSLSYYAEKHVPLIRYVTIETANDDFIVHASIADKVASYLANK